jgi:hypothetical protein
LRPADKFHQTTIVFDLFGNNQLAVYKVSNCQMIGRAMLESVFYLFVESRVSLFQVRNGCLRHDTLQDRCIFVGELETARTMLMWISDSF